MLNISQSLVFAMMRPSPVPGYISGWLPTCLLLLGFCAGCDALERCFDQAHEVD
jgi:hypothetical protein